jgi:hypothetical protein
MSEQSSLSGPYCSWCQARLPEHAPACERFGQFKENHPNNRPHAELDGEST